MLFVMGSLGGGGSERQLLEILRNLDRTRFEPSLYLIYRHGELLQDLPSDVPVLSYWDDRPFPRLNFPGRILLSQARELSRIIRQQRIDLVYDRSSHMTLTTSLATCQVKVPRISVIVVDPQLDLVSSHSRYAWLKRSLLRRAYHSAARTVAVSEGVRESAMRVYDLSAEKVMTCYNVFDVDALRARCEASVAGFDEGRFHVVSVGRLQHQKGQLYLLQAIELLVRQNRIGPMRLWLVGDGPDRPCLQEFVRQRALTEIVTFVGFQSNPLPYVRQADLFCLPSLFEGMPNALVEAMICQTPVVSSDCPSGPREILAAGQWGDLVPPADAVALAAAIQHAYEQQAASCQRAAAAYHSVVERFSLASGMARWEALFEEVVASRAK